MKFTFWILSAYSISLLSCAEIKVHPTAKNLTNEVDKCPKDKSFPVCGTNGVENLLFGNECLLKQAGQKGGEYTTTKLKTCFKDCDLICLGYYDPVCAINPATNKTRTFNNKCEIIRDACSNEIDWKFKKLGKCTKLVKRIKRIKVKVPSKKLTKRKPKPIPCPKIFNPVCAIFTGVKSTFINECLVNAENVKTGKDWRIFSQGICEEDYSSVSKPPKHHAIKKRSLDFKEFGNFDHAFDFGEPVTFIRPPPVFHTQFIKNEDSVGIFDRAESSLRSFYENQPESKAGLLPSYIEENPNLQSQLPIEDFGFKEFLGNLPNNETPNLFYQQSNKMQTHYQNQELNKIQTQCEKPKGFQAAYQTILENSRPTTVLNHRQMNAENCKLGTTQLCGSFQDKTRTFKNICELNLHNELTGEDWQLEYEGVCKNCNFMCSKVYEPLCISMNGLLYTIRNECVLNAAICKNKERAWRIIKSGVCDEDVEQQYKKIIIRDKYETVAPGFRYTSNYHQLESTTMKAIPAEIPKAFDAQLQTSNETYSNSKPNKKDAKDLVFVLKPLTKAQKIEDFKNSKKAKKLEKEEKLSITSKNPLKEKDMENDLEKFENAANKSTNQERLSMYGPHGNSIMTKLIKALDGTSQSLLPNLKQQTKAEGQ